MCIPKAAPQGYGDPDSMSACVAPAEPAQAGKLVLDENHLREAIIAELSDSEFIADRFGVCSEPARSEVQRLAHHILDRVKGDPQSR